MNICNLTPDIVAISLSPTDHLAVFTCNADTSSGRVRDGDISGIVAATASKWYNSHIRCGSASIPEAHASGQIHGVESDSKRQRSYSLDHIG